MYNVQTAPVQSTAKQGAKQRLSPIVSASLSGRPLGDLHTCLQKLLNPFSVEKVLFNEMRPSVSSFGLPCLPHLRWTLASLHPRLEPYLKILRGACRPACTQIHLSREQAAGHNGSQTVSPLVGALTEDASLRQSADGFNYSEKAKCSLITC